MPHKHTRKAGASDASHFDLAPSATAKPLPAYAGVTKSSKKQDAAKQQKRKRDKKARAKDDTPRAFARLMQFQATGKRPSGLDDDSGERRAKKRKVAESTTLAPAEGVAEAVPEKAELPKLLSGERLADYAARVDQALPVGNLVRRGGPKIDGLKERQTRTEKRLHKMYASWREEEARIREKEEERQELDEEAEDEKRAMYGKDYHDLDRRRQKAVGETDDGDDDPWAVLKYRRAEKERLDAEEKGRRKGGLKGVHDVVQAPPSLKVIPKEEFKTRNGAQVDVANIPASAGSLKRREVLSDARRDVIERYRAMMKGKGGL